MNPRFHVNLIKNYFLVFSFIALLLFPNFNSLFGQVVIKEKIEITTPYKSSIQKGINTIASNSHSVKFEIDWDKPNRKGYLRTDNESVGWIDGGHLELTVDNVVSPGYIGFQFKVNLYVYEPSTVNYKIFVNGDLVVSESVILVGKRWSIPYKNVSYFLEEEDNCEDYACDGDYVSEVPTFEVSGDYPNGYNGFNHCDDIKKPQGYFYAFLNNIETAFEPFTLDVCYNSNRDKWQMKVDNSIKIRAITDICINNLGNNVITKIEEVDNISKELICDALVQIKGYKKYPIGRSIAYASFDFTEIYWAHELAHKTEFANEMLPNALGNFSENLNLFNLSCDDENDIEDVKEEAYELFNNALENLLGKLRNEVNKKYPKKFPGKVLESEKENHKKVQSLVEKYVKRIEKRMKELNIN